VPTHFWGPPLKKSFDTTFLGATGFNDFPGGRGNSSAQSPPLLRGHILVEEAFFPPRGSLPIRKGSGYKIWEHLLRLPRGTTLFRRQFLGRCKERTSASGAPEEKLLPQQGGDPPQSKRRPHNLCLAPL